MNQPVPGKRLCRECRQSLTHATETEPTPPYTTRMLLWCANSDCKAHGIMIEDTETENQNPVY
jgi:hypothetical protein